MSNTPKIDEIFAPLIDSPSLTLTTTYWNEAKDQLYQLILEVIGEDDDVNSYINQESDEDLLITLGENANNRLRAEQRQKLSDLFGKN